jgi:hypothetical protein
MHTSGRAWRAYVWGAACVYSAGASNQAKVPLLTTDDLWALLQVSRPVVKHLLRSGDLPGVVISLRAGWRVTPSVFYPCVRDQHIATRASVRATPPPPLSGMWDPTLEAATA